MKTVITGGAGFIGGHLCGHFLRKGWEVVCVDNFITGDKKNIDAFSSHPKFKLIEHDVAKFINIKDPVDYILHFASPASPRDYLEFPIQTLKVGSLGTHNALGLAKEKRATFLLASTSEVYGDPEIHPQPESYWGNVNPVGPRGVYDEAKRFAEALTLAYHRTHGIDTKIVRIFNTFGPNMRHHDGRAIPEFIDQALKGDDLTVFGNGSQTRSFMFIDDLVCGIDRLITSECNDPVNIGNPLEMSIADLAFMIIKLTVSQSKVVHKELPIDDPKVRQPDISKAKSILDWTPKVNLEDGLVKTIEYFKKGV